MATQAKGKKKTTQSQWSSDQLLVRYLIGLTLIALGALVFLSVTITIDGAVFAGVRHACYGLAGGMAFLLPVVPIWGGVLVILSTRFKPSLRAWGAATGIYLLALNLLNLLSTTGAPAMPLMDYIRQMNLTRSYLVAPDAYEAYLSEAFSIGVSSQMGGGLLGMLLSWPLWKALGVVGGVIVSLLAMLGLTVLLFHVDVRKIFHQLRSRGEEQKQAELEQQKLLTQRELNYMRQQEAARLQQAQRWAAAQQAAQRTTPTAPVQPYYPQGYASPYAPPQSRYQRPNPVSQPPEPVPQGFMPPEALDEQYAPMEGGSIYEEYADPRQVTQARQTGQRPKRSKIFGRKAEKVKAEAEPLPEEPAWPPMAPAEEQWQPQAPAWQPSAQPQEPTYWQEPQEPSPAPDWQEPPQEEYPPESANMYFAPESAFPQETADLQEAPLPPWETPVPTGEAPITKRLHALQHSAPVETPAPRRQQPKPSWTDDAPPVGQAVQPSVRQQEQRLQGRYEDTAMPATSATLRVPVLQPDQPQPKGGWEPELKLPPRREEAPAPEAEAAPIAYTYPNLALLKSPAPPNPAGEEEDAFRAQRLEETLKSFKIPACVRHITHGPAISRFELEMAAGIKVNKVTELDRNIAMNMEVKSVRIEAPIPGKSLVGVEVPNRKVTAVTLREVLETKEMKELSSPLGVALGKDIAGLPIVCDLARMPHLLIAGATGSGKSVCVNAMINSILFRSTPEQVRMILIDPKVVELQCYNGIPHLLIPVVSDPHKAAGALSWAVTEMMERYQKFTDRGVREITGYNSALEEGEQPMPRILIVIDELADLMMSCKKEVEEYICRLAQLARAAGIHLVVATQRPSVDVITGLIKANIPSRIAFKVSSNVDSRTILDRNGAEKLLGYGDMLYLPNGEFTPIRVQGCFLTDSEVNRVTDFIRQHSQADYDPDVLETLERSAAEEDGGADVVDAGNTTDGVDPLLSEAIEMAIMDGQTSISMLQRRLRIGYARAGRLIDEMTRRGVISSAAGAKPRQVLISREQFQQMSFDD